MQFRVCETSGGEEPGDAEDGGDDGDARDDVLLVAAVEVVVHPRSESAAHFPAAVSSPERTTRSS